MKTVTLTTVFLACAGLISASCSSGHGAAAPTFSGDSVVLDAVQHTSETADPVTINGQNLTFSDDPHAFDSLFH